jgi:hypothetical protein
MLREPAAETLIALGAKPSSVKEIDDINYLKVIGHFSGKVIKKNLKTIALGSYKVLPRIHSFWAKVDLTDDIWTVLLARKHFEKKKHVALVLLLAVRAVESGSISVLAKSEFMNVWGMNLSNRKLRDHPHAKQLYDVLKKATPPSSHVEAILSSL